MEIDTRNFHPTKHWFVPISELDADEGAQLRPAHIKPSAVNSEMGTNQCLVG